MLALENWRPIRALGSRTTKNWRRCQINLFIVVTSPSKLAQAGKFALRVKFARKTRPGCLNLLRHLEPEKLTLAPKHAEGGVW